MDRAQLLAETAGAGAGPQDVVFVGRWAVDYRART